MNRYGSVDLGPDTGDETNIARLQSDLKTLGFEIVGPVDGKYGRNTFHAVREFQSYAKYARVGQVVRDAERKFDRLDPVETGNNRYKGYVDGLANRETGDLLEHWLDSNWRCPVMINVWTIDRLRTKQSLQAENVWRYNDYTSSSGPSVAFFGYDLSGHFRNTGTLDDGTVLLGYYNEFQGYGGPLSTPPRFTDPLAEITPERLVGRSYAALTAAEQSTFRVVRAVSEVECYGFFDCINAYDRALVSMGPCHWTLGLVNRKTQPPSIDKGELCGTLSYAAWRSRRAYEFYFSFYGVNARDNWIDENGHPTGSRLFDPVQRKYSSWLSFIDASGNYSPVPNIEADGNYFKSWHWIYRYTAAMRESADLRKAIWDMARIRLRNVGEIQLSVAGADRRVDEVFTSELARALLHRWHIYRPSEIASSGPGLALQRILQTATRTQVEGGWATNPARWTNDHESALLNAIDEATTKLGNKNLKQTMSEVRSWPQWWIDPRKNYRKYQLKDGLAALSSQRRSFQFAPPDDNQAVA